MIKIYGIKNCDTIKKTLKWFEAQKISYEFIDYKKNPPTEELAKKFITAHNWETVINKRGTTWRKLDDSTKESMNPTSAIALIQAQPSIIKRPIVEQDGRFIVGYDEAEFGQLI